MNQRHSREGLAPLGISFRQDSALASASAFTISFHNEEKPQDRTVHFLDRTLSTFCISCILPCSTRGVLIGRLEGAQIKLIYPAIFEILANTSLAWFGGPWSNFGQARGGPSSKGDGQLSGMVTCMAEMERVRGMWEQQFCVLAG